MRATSKPCSGPWRPADVVSPNWPPVRASRSFWRLRATCSIGPRPSPGRRCAAWGDGSARAVDYLDSDALSNVPVRISISVTLADGLLTVDFDGTDPQVQAALNIASFGTTHAWLTTRILGW